MPLDRRITVKIFAEGTFDKNGDYTPGAPTDYEIWGERQATGSSDQETEGGIVVTSSARWTVRWFRELALAAVRNVAVVDEYGHMWNVESVNEGDVRRRFIEIGAVREII